MTRNLHSVIVQAASAPVVKPFFAVQLVFDSTPLYFWTGIGDLTIGAITYTGAGTLLHISEIQEGADLSAKGATIGLSGVPSNMLTAALTEDYQGRVCKILFGIFDDEADDPAVLLLETDSALLMENGDRFDISYDTTTFVFDLFTGRMDQMNINEGATESTITLSVESKMIDLKKPRIRRYTHEDQIAEYPGDLAFEFVNELQSKSIPWGA